MGPLATESHSSIVTAPARTGNDSTSSRAIMAIDHTNSGIRSRFILFVFLLIVVVIKFTAPRIEDTPSNVARLSWPRWREAAAQKNMTST